MIVCPITALECDSDECSVEQLGQLPMYSCRMSKPAAAERLNQGPVPLAELASQMRTISEFIQNNVPMDKRMGSDAETAVYLMQLALAKR